MPPLIRPPLLGSLNHAAREASSGFMGPDPSGVRPDHARRCLPRAMFILFGGGPAGCGGPARFRPQAAEQIGRRMVLGVPKDLRRSPVRKLPLATAPSPPSFLPASPPPRQATPRPQPASPQTARRSANATLTQANAGVLIDSRRSRTCRRTAWGGRIKSRFTKTGVCVCLPPDKTPGRRQRGRPGSLHIFFSLSFLAPRISRTRFPDRFLKGWSPHEGRLNAPTRKNKKKIFTGQRRLARAGG